MGLVPISTPSTPITFSTIRCSSICFECLPHCFGCLICFFLRLLHFGGILNLLDHLNEDRICCNGCQCGEEALPVGMLLLLMNLPLILTNHHPIQPDLYPLWLKYIY